jgi:UDP-glucose 4-epimerase
MIIFGDGRQTRDFTYVSDTARGILLAGFCKEAVGQTMNIGQGREITIGSLARKVRKTLRKPRAVIFHDKPRPGDVLRLYANTALAHKLMGFRPTITFEQGLTKLHAWYLSSGTSPETLLRQERVHNWNPLEISKPPTRVGELS